MPHLRVATWNVHGSVGFDGRRDPARQLQVLRRMDADCIAVQEFVNEHALQGGLLLDHWCESLRMHGVFARGFTRSGQEFGNAILSRHPLGDPIEHDISAPGGRRRVVLEVRMKIGTHTVRLLCVHCAVRARPRVAQYDMLLALLQQGTADLTLLAGDFNEWRAWNPGFREIARLCASGPPLATFPAIAPAVPLDRIWVHPADRLLETRVDSARPAGLASDHLPVVASVMLP